MPRYDDIMKNANMVLCEIIMYKIVTNSITLYYKQLLCR